MPYRQRKSPRKPGFDYTTDGVYFVTICTQNRLHLFGHIQNGLVCWNPAGGMVARWWEALPEKFAGVTLDSTVVMPNHTHALICLQHTNPVGANQRVRPQQKTAVGIPAVMQWFKTMTTNAYIHGVKNHSWERFEGRLWQRSYHDYIVRDESGWGRIRQYIASNPALWECDTFYSEG